MDRLGVPTLLTATHVVYVLKHKTPSVKIISLVNVYLRRIKTPPSRCPFRPRRRHLAAADVMGRAVTLNLFNA